MKHQLPRSGFVQHLISEADRRSHPGSGPKCSQFGLYALLTTELELSDGTKAVGFISESTIERYDKEILNYEKMRHELARKARRVDPSCANSEAGYAIHVQHHAPLFIEVLTNLCSSSGILSGGRTKSTQPEA